MPYILRDEEGLIHTEFSEPPRSEEGELIEGAEFVEEVTDSHMTRNMARYERDGRLAQSDWTQSAEHLTEEQRAAWAAYRQDLRDVPAQEGFPLNITWPPLPS